MRSSATRIVAAMLLFFVAGPGVSAEAQTPHDIGALARTVVEEFDVSPDASLLAFKSAAAGTYDVWTVPTSGGEPKQLTSSPGREMAPRFSPDGRSIVFEADVGGTDVRDLYLVPAEGGEPERLADHPLNDTGASFLPDGKKLYFTTQMFWRGSTAVMDLATREVRRVGPGGGLLSPDGSMLVFPGNEKPNDDVQSNSDIYVMPSTGGEPRPLTADTFDALYRAPAWSKRQRNGDRHPVGAKRGDHKSCLFPVFACGISELDGHG